MEWKELTCRRIQRPRQGSLLKVVAKLLSTDGPDLTGRSGVVDQHVVDLVDHQLGLKPDQLLQASRVFASF